MATNGAAFVQALGVDVDARRASGRPLCKACLDWANRRSQLAARWALRCCKRSSPRAGRAGWTAAAPVAFNAPGLAAFERAFAVALAA